MQTHLITLCLFILLVAGCKLTASSHQSEQSVSSTPTPATVESQTKNAQDTPADPDEPTPVPPPQRTREEASTVCPDPGKPCHHKEKRFDDWELPFRLPARLKANTPYQSAPFYAVILKTYPMGEDCDGGEFIEAAERDRRREQSNQLARKVFGSYECPNMVAVQYDFEGRMDASGESVKLGNFIALYAGETRAEAEEALRFMKSEYPQAMLKQMTASYEKIEQ
jgi:hypothetical protein